LEIDPFFASFYNLPLLIFATRFFTMAPSALEREDKARDAAFNKVLHGKSAQAQGGLAALRGKDAAAQKAAVDEYFKHWDNQTAADETPEMREV
jgi:sterol 24-C-methyltransferase